MINSTTNATVAAVNSSASAVTLLAADPNRAGYSLYNASSAVLYLIHGEQTPTTALYTIAIAASGYYECPFNYVGKVQGIWASANGQANVTVYR